METVDSSENVSLPQYEYDKELKIYREKPPPEQKIFKAVGYNDQETIVKIMELMEKLPKKMDDGQKLKVTRKSAPRKKTTLGSKTMTLNPDDAK